MLITTRVAYEAACAVYNRYIAEGRNYGDDWKFMCELAYHLGEFDRTWRPANIDE